MLLTELKITKPSLPKSMGQLLKMLLCLFYCTWSLQEQRLQVLKQYANNYINNLKIQRIYFRISNRIEMFNKFLKEKIEHRLKSLDDISSLDYRCNGRTIPYFDVTLMQLWLINWNGALAHSQKQGLKFIGFSRIFQIDQDLRATPLWYSFFSIFYEDYKASSPIFLAIKVSYNQHIYPILKVVNLMIFGYPWSIRHFLCHSLKIMSQSHQLEWCFSPFILICIQVNWLQPKLYYPEIKFRDSSFFIKIHC